MPVVRLGRSQDARKFTGTVWGNGEFGLAVQKSFKLSVPLRSTGQETESWSLYRRILPDLRATVHGGKEGSYERADLCLEQRQPAHVEVSETTFENLGLSLLANSHTRAKRGSKGITPYASKLVRNACVELEERFGKDRISFLTLTLPPIATDELHRVIAAWGEIVKVIHQWIRRRLVQSGLPPHIVGVTEIQSERFQRSGFLGYHLHLAFVGRQNHRGWAILPHEFRSAWQRAVEARLARPEAVRSWRASARVERVLYSLEGYLGKYLTKGSREVKEVIQKCGEEFLVSAWHTISREVKEVVLKKRLRGNGKVFEFLAELCESDLDNIFIYKRKVYIEDGDFKIPWGWTGKLTLWGKQLLKDFTSPN